MFELIPSETMRQFYKDTGFKFTDFQRATLIWNAPNVTRAERLDALKELAETTTDEVIKAQIRERLEVEDKIFTVFMDNFSSKYIYVVEDNENFSCGFFSTYARAEAYAINYMEKHETNCSICKYLVVNSDDDMIVRNPLRGNPNMGITSEKFCEYSGQAVSGVSLDRKGKILHLWTNELLPEEEVFILDEYNTERFEFSFIKIPFELQVGTLVRNVSNNVYGILAQGKREWDQYLKRIEDEKIYVDYSDVQVIVYTPNAAGKWFHEHMNPLYLEVVSAACAQGDDNQDKLKTAMKTFRDCCMKLNRLV